MERLTYELRINAEERFYETISSIVELQPESYKYGWSYEIVFEEQEERFDIISKLLDALEGRYEKLQIGFLLFLKLTEINKFYMVLNIITRCRLKC